MKIKIFEKAVEEFTDFGYEFIGIDHFAKPNDELSTAQKNKSLYRNFQGYTTHSGCDLFGLGVTAISDIAGLYKQNPKKLNEYYKSWGADKFLLCSDDDVRRRELIKLIMCNNEAILDLDLYGLELKELDSFINDGIIELSYDYDARKAKLKVTELGRFFVRNIASKFDTYLMNKSGHKHFSKAL